MTFSELIFKNSSIYEGATRAKHSFSNEWIISVVSGPEGSGIKGIISQDTFEVLIYNQKGVMLDDILEWQTPVQISSIMRVINML